VLAVQSRLQFGAGLAEKFFPVGEYEYLPAGHSGQFGEDDGLAGSGG
jgi:hypothetical protein